MDSTFYPPIKIITAILEPDGLNISSNNGSFSLKWNNITHICSVCIARNTSVYYLVFYTKSEPKPYIITSDSFNYLKILDKFLNNQQQNFLEILKIFVENSKKSFVDWSLRDVLNSGDLSGLPQFNDLAHVMSYCNDVRINNKYEEQNVQDSIMADYPSVIFTKTLEKLRKKRESSEFVITKLKDRLSVADEQEQLRCAKMVLTEIDELLSQDNWLISGYILKAEILRNLNKTSEAANCLMFVINMYFEDGANASLYLTLSQVLNSLGLNAAENKILTDYYGLFPSKKITNTNLAKISNLEASLSNDWYKYYNYGYEMLQREEFSSALEMFNQSISAFPSFCWSYYWKGKCLRILEKQDQAIEFFLQSNKLSQNVLSIIEIAEIYEEQNRSDLAQDYYKQAMDLRPNIPELYLFLAKNLLNYTKDNIACFKMLLKAIEIEPYGELAEDALKMAESLSQLSDDNKNKQLDKRDDMEIGGVFENNYLIQEIYKGGMGIVYIVKDLNSSEIYALKTFQDKFLWDSSIINMFHKEAEIWVRLGVHNNIVRAINVKNFEGKPYIFLEYIDSGTDLEKILSQEKLSIGQVLDFALQFCNGMSYSYKTMGLIHQDIKPSNCMITKEGILKITDFGLVKIFTESSVAEDSVIRQSNTTSGSAISILSSSVKTGSDSKIFSIINKNKSLSKSIGSSNSGYDKFGSIKRLSNSSSLINNEDSRQIVGTIPYMAPEQLTGEFNSGTATDIYSFGAMLYEMLIGTPPFGNTDLEECVVGHLELEPKNPCDLRNDIPPALGKIVIRCLRKEPSERYEDFSELFNQINLVYESIYNSTYIFGISLKDGQNSHTDFISQGEALISLSKYKEAVTAFGKALNLMPNSSMAYAGVGECYRRVGKYKEALTYLNKALSLDPANANAVYYLGLLYFSQKDLKNAYKYFEQSSKLNPDNVEVWLKLGAIYDISNNMSEALNNYNLAIKINPRHSIAWNSKGHLFYRQKKYYDAMDCFIKAIQFNPRYYSAWFNQADLQQELNLNEESIVSYRKVLELKPSYVKAWIGMATSYKRLGSFKDALTFYDKALEVNPNDVSTMLLKAVCLFSSGLTEKSIEILQSALKIEPKKLEVIKFSVFVLMELFDYETALALCEKGLNLEPQNNLLVTYKLHLKSLLTKRGFISNHSVIWFYLNERRDTISETAVDLDYLIEEYKNMLKSSPESKLIHFRIALLYRVYDKKELAIEHLKKSFDYQGTCLQNLIAETDYRKRLTPILKKNDNYIAKLPKFKKIMEEGCIYLNEKNYTQALLTFQKIIMQDYRNVLIWNKSALCKYHEATYVEALDLVSQGLARNPLDTDLWVLKADIVSKQNNFKQAIDLYQIALYIDPSCSVALFKIITLFESLGYFKSAGEFASKYLSFYKKLSEKSFRAVYTVCVIFMTQERYSACREFLNTFMSKYPKKATLLNIYIDIRQGNFETAYNNLDEFVGSDFNNETHYFLLLKGYCCLKTDRYEEAVTLLNQITTQFDFFTLSIYYKVVAMNALPGNTKEGLILLSSLLNSHPSDYFLWLANALLNFQEKQWDVALWSFDKALELNSKSFSALFNKGILLNKLGKYKEAVDCFGSILEFYEGERLALSFKAISLYLKGEYDSVIDICENIILQNSDIPHVFHCKALSLYKKNKYEESLEAVQLALDKEPDNPEILNTKGIIMRRLDNLSDEIFSYNRALELNPDCITANLNKGIWLAETDEYEQAHIYFDKVISIDAENGIAWREKGRCQYEMGHFKEALRCYNLSIQYLINDIEAYNGKAEVLIEIGRLDEAIHFIDKSLEFDETQANIWNNKGVLLAKLSNSENAYQAFLKAYEQKDTYDFVIYNLLLMAAEANREEDILLYEKRFKEIETTLTLPSGGKSVLLEGFYRKKLPPHISSDFKELFKLKIDSLPYIEFMKTYY